MKIFKLSIIITIFIMLASGSLCFADTQEDFTLTVLKDNKPVRVFDGRVAIPFDTEYKLRLKNNHQRRCSATVYIDGAKVSEIGDFVIDGNDKLDLERFLDRSLTEGKRFKFVPLSNPAVDDPSRAENGIIMVEFRLEKLQEIMPKERYWKKQEGVLILDGQGSIITGDEFLSGFVSGLFIGDTYSSTSILYSTTNAGATIPGSYSSQSFYNVVFDGEDEIITIQIKMVGIKR